MKRILLLLFLLFVAQETIAQCDYLPSSLNVARLEEESTIYQQVCLGTNEKFQVRSTNGSDISYLNFSYAVQGGYVVSKNGPDVVVRWTSTGTQKLTVTATNNCGSSTVKHVGVYVENSAPSWCTVSGPSDACVGAPSEYRGNSGSTVHTYKYRVEALDGGSAPTVTFYGDVYWNRPGSFRVFATAMNGCGDGPTGSKTVTVSQSPVAPAAISGDLHTCLNSTYTYSVSPIAGENYQWTITGGSIVTNVNRYTKKVKWTTAGRGYVSVKATTPNCGISAEKKIQVIVENGVPAGGMFRILPYKDNVCSGDPKKRYYVWSSADPVRNWRLSGGGRIVSSTDREVWVEWTSPGKHTLFGTPYNICGDGPDLVLEVFVDGTMTPYNTGGDITSEKKTAYQITLRWNDLDGTGKKHLVVVRKNDGSVGDVLPKDGVGYSASSTFGQGQEIGPGNFVVHKSGYTSFILYGLEPCTNYKATVYEFNENLICNNAGPSHSYFTTGAKTYTWSTPRDLNDLLAPEPTVNSSSIITSNVSPSTISLNWTKGNGSNRLIIARQGFAVSKAPVDKKNYTASSTFGSGHHFGEGNYAVYNGTGTGFNMFGLQAYTWYYFKVFEFNVSDCQYYANYMSSGPTKGQRTTEEIDFPDDPCMYYSVYTGDGTEDQLIIKPIEPCLYGADPGNIQPSTVTMEADHSLHIQLSQVTGSASEVEVYDMMGNLLLRDTMAPGETDKRVAMELGREHALLIVRVKHQYGVDAHKIAVR